MPTSTLSFPDQLETTQATHSIEIKEHIVEIVSDAGEGAQTAGQTFGTISARMRNGVWTEEIIPAEIEPPHRTATGASGIRVRIGSTCITNAGDEADLIVAFNEQALVGRERAGHLKKGSTILLENKWRNHSDESIASEYARVYDELDRKGYQIYEIPMEEECLSITDNPQRGKNMFVLGMLCNIYSRDMVIARQQLNYVFRKKGETVLQTNIRLLKAGYDWAEHNLDLIFDVPSASFEKSQIVVTGNIAIALGIMASGMEVCAMYPITPATSVAHYLSEVFENVGGLVHQAEDEIAACGFAIGASYAGKCAVTITSGPGLALKTEMIGLAAMAEIPLVVVNVQRGGPSTGLPTKVEQGDLMSSIFGTPGDAPKVVLAPATIEDCFYSIITARKIAEQFRMPVIVLSDASLATGQQPFPKPEFSKEWLASPFDQSPVADSAKPYDWNPRTGLSSRVFPGPPGGMFNVTRVSHTRDAKVAYEPGVNQEGCDHRSLKLATLQKTLKTPKVFGDPEGDLLILGWGSTKGAIEEAVQRARADGLKVSSLHIKFLQPMASGIKELLHRFKSVVTVEINFSDNPDREMVTEDNRRYSSLAWILRARYLVDVDCWSNVHGHPMKPAAIEKMIRERMAAADKPRINEEAVPCLG